MLQTRKWTSWEHGSGCAGAPPKQREWTRARQITSADIALEGVRNPLVRGYPRWTEQCRRAQLAEAGLVGPGSQE